MPLACILVLASLISASGSKTVLRTQAPDPSPTTSAPAPQSPPAPTDATPPAPPKTPSSGAARKRAKGARARPTAKQHRVQKDDAKTTPSGGARKIVVRQGGA